MRLGGMGTLLAWTGLSPQALKSRWLASQTAVAFETGRIRFDAFAPAIIEEFSLPIDPPALRDAMTHWMADPYPDAHQLLAALCQQGPVAFLCNINEVMWPVIQRELNPARWSSDVFLSFELGFAKPDPAIYRAVTAATRRPPEELVFFDDTLENVQAAVAEGWHAEQVQGCEELRTALERLALL